MASRLIHLISKKTNWTCSILFLLISKKHVKHAFLSFPCLAITSNFLITHYFHVRMVVLSCVHVPFYFSLPLIFTLLARCFLAASISHFLTAALNFRVFLPTKFVSFVFNDSLQLFLCYPAIFVQTSENNAEKDTTVFVFLELR